MERLRNALSKNVSDRNGLTALFLYAACVCHGGCLEVNEREEIAALIEATFLAPGAPLSSVTTTTILTWTTQRQLMCGGAAAHREPGAFLCAQSEALYALLAYPSAIASAVASLSSSRSLRAKGEGEEEGGGGGGGGEGSSRCDNEQLQSLSDLRAFSGDVLAAESVVIARSRSHRHHGGLLGRLSLFRRSRSRSSSSSSSGSGSSRRSRRSRRSEDGTTTTADSASSASSSPPPSLLAASLRKNLPSLPSASNSDSVHTPPQTAQKKKDLDLAPTASLFATQVVVDVWAPGCDQIEPPPLPLHCYRGPAISRAAAKTYASDITAKLREATTRSWAEGLRLTWHPTNERPGRLQQGISACARVARSDGCSPVAVLPAATQGSKQDKTTMTATATTSTSTTSTTSTSTSATTTTTSVLYSDGSIATLGVDSKSADVRTARIETQLRAKIASKGLGPICDAVAIGGGTSGDMVVSFHDSPLLGHVSGLRLQTATTVTKTTSRDDVNTSNKGNSVTSATTANTNNASISNSNSSSRSIVSSSIRRHVKLMVRSDPMAGVVMSRRSVVQVDPTAGSVAAPIFPARTGGFVRASPRDSSSLILWWPAGTEARPNVIALDLLSDTRQLVPRGRFCTGSVLHALDFGAATPDGAEVLVTVHNIAASSPSSATTATTIAATLASSFDVAVSSYRFEMSKRSGTVMWRTGSITAPLDAPLTAHALRPDGAAMLLLDAAGTLTLVRVPKPALLSKEADVKLSSVRATAAAAAANNSSCVHHRLALGEAASCMTWHPDGHLVLVATAAQNGTVTLLDSTLNRVALTSAGMNAPVPSHRLSFSPVVTEGICHAVWLSDNSSGGSFASSSSNNTKTTFVVVGKASPIVVTALSGNSSGGSDTNVVLTGVLSRLRAGDCTGAATAAGRVDWEAEPELACSCARAIFEHTVRLPYNAERATVLSSVLSSLPASVAARLHSLQWRFLTYLLAHNRLVDSLRLVTRLGDRDLCQTLARACRQRDGDTAALVGSAAEAAALLCSGEGKIARGMRRVLSSYV